MILVMGYCTGNASLFLTQLFRWDTPDGFEVRVPICDEHEHYGLTSRYQVLLTLNSISLIFLPIDVACAHEAIGMRNVETLG